MWPELAPEGVSRSEKEFLWVPGKDLVDAVGTQANKVPFPKAHIPRGLREAMCLLQILGRENSAESKGITSQFLSPGFNSHFDF